MRKLKKQDPPEKSSCVFWVTQSHISDHSYQDSMIEENVDITMFKGLSNQKKPGLEE